MNKIVSILFFFSVVLLLNAGCEKETFVVKSLQFGCQTTVFKVPGWYTDSIYYSDNEISLIDKKFDNHSEKNIQARFEYNENEVQIFVKDISEGVWGDAFSYIFSYNDSKISQITSNSGRVKANYYYENNYLSYILYHSESILTDSIVVEYDSQGSNIIRAMWYKLNEINNKFKLANTANYTYDNKNNPHRNSLHFLYNFYDCEEYSLDYFNRNNLKTIKSTLCEIHTEYIYNEYGSPIYVVFKNKKNQATDSNIFDYSCN